MMTFGLVFHDKVLTQLMRLYCYTVDEVEGVSMVPHYDKRIRNAVTVLIMWVQIPIMKERKFDS